ncbi:response regulator [Ochrobactrum pecoris]|uniref:Polar-differentiation response regulator DivK n=1 Tax=Brucella pecoris TaxID=867683 RepID=A0A5C5CIY8_9HYPH|nr:response regulator [Brucella pecoris]MBB4094878.1 two-component system chemotaxis response regulator CheY [Brucella pecoris]NKW79790.1 response regulator [Brucella pecoris]TNV11061.1 response regulator [Brucella pecoris]
MANEPMTGYCLLVDDSSVIRKVARRILSETIAEFAEASTGREALETCFSRMPDVVLLDYDLPDMTALEVVTELRAMPNGKQPRIVLCLYELDVTRIMRAKRAGADGYILKPFDRAYLTDQFAGILSA